MLQPLLEGARKLRGKFEHLTRLRRWLCFGNGTRRENGLELGYNRHQNFLLLVSITFTTILIIASYNGRQNLPQQITGSQNSDRFFNGIQSSPSSNGEGNELPSEFQFQTSLWRPAVPIRTTGSRKQVKNSGGDSDLVLGNKNTEKQDQNEKFNFVTYANSNLGFNLDMSEFADDRILLQREWIRNFTKSKILMELKPKKILVLDGYNSYFGHNGCLNCPTESPDPHSEKIDSAAESIWNSKCIFVEDHWWTGFFRNIEEFDAVIGIRNWVYRIYEGKLPSWVKQILFTVESPFVTRLADVSVNNAFLASYWRGSDITMPYAKWVAFSSRNISNATHSHSDSGNKSVYNFATSKSRTKLAAIVVSDCDPQNNRLGYVRELQRYIPVDIFGKCGTSKCNEPCFDNLKKEYKFYLAFENANCRDYITEKFFRNALKYDMVPVVLGAHKKDYLYAAPPHSFIHVEDFESPAKLAEYLKFLNENDSKYNEYFEWKTKGDFIDAWQDFFCRSCALLFIADFVQPPIWPQGATWKELNYCLPPGRWYWNRNN